jgi:hypothetical protein
MSTNERQLVFEAVSEIVESKPVDAVVDELLDEASIGRLSKYLGMGAGIGALGGAFKGYRRAKREKTSRARGALSGAAKGAGIGAAGGLAAAWLTQKRDILKKATKAAFAAVKKNPGAVAVSAGATATIYDFMKARGFTKDLEYIMDVIKNKKPVNSKQFTAKIDKKIICATNGAELYRALKREKRLVREVDDMDLRIFADEMGRVLQQKQNAFAMRGENIDLIGVPSRTNAHVIAHEIGHILDFREKNMTMWDMREYNRTFSSILLKYKYEQQVMTAEKEAWRRSPSKEDEEKAKARTAALGTYEKGFHITRGVLIGQATLLALTLTLAHMDGQRN